MARLTRKDHHTVNIQLDGYEPFAMNLTRGVSGWVAGNIIFGGLIGLAVDAITVGMYKLTPDQVSATLSRRVTSAEDALFITVVLTPDPAWERIGTLTREQAAGDASAGTVVPRHVGGGRCAPAKVLGVEIVPILPRATPPIQACPVDPVLPPCNA
mgnify:FL=1